MLTADLSGWWTKLDAASENAVWGEVATLEKVQIRNQGTSPSGNFKLEWYLSTDKFGSNDDILLGLAGGGTLYSHSSIAAGAEGTLFSVDLQLPTTNPLSGSDFFIITKIDTLNEVAESNENNNFGGLQLQWDHDNIHISNDIDLSGWWTRVDNSNETTTWGDVVTLNKVQIRNTGTDPSGTFALQWYLSTDAVGSVNDVLLSQPGGATSYSHASVAAGGFGDLFAIDLQLPSINPLAGNEFFVVTKVDAFEEVAETNESNNFGGLQLQWGHDNIQINGPPNPLATVSVAPNVIATQTGTPITLKARFQHEDGYTNIKHADARITDGFANAQRCHVRYDENTDSLLLYDTATQQFFNAGSPGSGTTMTTTECSLHAGASSTAVVDANTLDVSFNVSFNAAMNGAKDVWLESFDDIGSASVKDDHGDVIIGSTEPPIAPTTISATPNTFLIDVGDPVTFTARFQDANGYENLRLADTRIADQFSSAPRCLVRFDQNTNSLLLFDDATQQFINAGVPGSGITVSNAECTLNAAASSTTVVDVSTLDITYDLSFTSAMKGDSNIWLKAFDDIGLASSNDDRGDLSVETTDVPTAPTTISVVPNNAPAALNMPINLTARFQDNNGYQDLRLADVRIADGYSSGPRCMIRFDQNTNSLMLFDDVTEQFLVAGAPGGGTTVSNAECSLNAVASSTTIIDPRTLEVTFNVSFTPVLEGTNNIWLKAFDDVGLASSNDDRGDIHIGGTPPTNVSVTPTGSTIGVGESIVLTSRFSDVDGQANLRLTELRVTGAGFSNTPRCFVRYDYKTDVLSLFDQAINSFVAVGSPGSNNVVSNADCTLDANNSSVTTVDANTLDIALDLSFTATLEGQNNLWLRALDDDGLWSPYEDKGDLAILLPTPPVAESVTPDHGSVLSLNPVTLTGRFSDVNGQTNLAQVEFEVSNELAGSPRCFFQYDETANELKLYDDGLGSFVSAGAPGSSNSVSNLHCTLDASASSVAVVDFATLDVSINVSFATSMHGVRRIWLHATDDDNLMSGTLDAGELTINADASAPTPPENLVVVPGNGVVSAEWADNPEPNIAGYNLFRGTTSGGPYAQINTGLLTNSEFEDTSVVNGTEYIYVVTAVDNVSKESVYSAERKTTPGAGPWLPTPVSVTPFDAQVDLNTTIVLTTRYADGDGYGDMDLFDMRIGLDSGSLPRCYVRYAPGTNDLKLFDETNTVFMSAGSPGTGSPISNQYCTLDPAASSVNPVDSLAIDVSFAVSFNSSMESDYNIWARAESTNWSDFSDLGDLQVGEPLVKIVDGYTDKQSYNQNEVQQVFINAEEAVTGARIDLYDIEGSVVGSAYFNATPQTSPNADPAVEGFAYAPSFSYNTGNLPSGLYFWGNSFPVVVKDSSKTSEIRVVMPTNTQNAYECTGGRSLYGTCSGPQAQRVHFDRHFETTPLILPNSTIQIRRDRGGWASPYFYWLEQEINNLGSSYGALADIDLDDPTALDGAKVLVLPGHNEYWTRTARENVDAFVAAGGHLAVMSGNTMWWQSRYENDQLVVYKSFADPIPDPLLKTLNWNHPTLQYPILDSIGADFAHGGYIDQNPPNGAPASFNGYKVVAENSPLLAGTGLIEGEILNWDDVIVFTEYDGPPVSGSDGNGYPIIDNSVLGFHQVELVAFDHAYRLGPAYGTLLAFQATPTSGMVVNAGTMLWGYEMLKSPDAAQIQTISYNILDRFLNDQSVFSPPPPPPPAADFQTSHEAVLTMPFSSAEPPSRESLVEEVFRSFGEYVEMGPVQAEPGLDAVTAPLDQPALISDDQRLSHQHAEDAALGVNWLAELDDFE